MQLLIDTKGNVRCVYDEAIDLSAIGEIHIQRASHVEPVVGGQWTADLSPISGPTFGPFDHRSEALATEVAWLHQYWLLREHPELPAHE